MVKRKKVVTAHDIATAAGIRIHENGEIELLDEREAQTVVRDAFREAAANALAPDRRRTVH